MLILNGDIRVNLCNELNYAIEEQTVIQKTFFTKDELVGTKKWNEIGYYGDFRAVLNALLKREFDEDTTFSIQETIKMIDEAIESFSDLNISRDNYAKIVIDEDFHAIGKAPCYELIKRETIQYHRFTKEENIGKDKYVRLGFLPKIDVLLKTVLNEKIKEFINSKDELNMEDIMIFVEETINLISNVNINIDENYVEDNFEENNMDIEDEVVIEG